MTEYTNGYDEEYEEDEEQEELLTQQHLDFLARLQYQDIAAAAEEMEVSLQDVINWQRNPLFRASLKEQEALLKQNVTQQILLEAQNTMKMLNDLQEHVTFYQRIRVLESVTRIISSVTFHEKAIMDEQASQDKSNAARWLRYLELEEIHESNRRSAARKKAEAEANEGSTPSTPAPSQPTEPSNTPPPTPHSTLRIPHSDEGLRGGVRANEPSNPSHKSSPPCVGEGMQGERSNQPTEPSNTPPPTPRSALRIPHSEEGVRASETSRSHGFILSFTPGIWDRRTGD